MQRIHADRSLPSGTRWNSTFDVDTQQFGAPVIQLERDLHRWHGSFSFLKNPNGNFACTFYVSVLDEPAIKFAYNQETFRAPPPRLQPDRSTGDSRQRCTASV